MTALLASSVFERLTRAVPAHSLAAFRMGFGALLIWDCWRFIRDDRIWRYWIVPEFHFSYAGFSWVKPLPEAWLELAWLSMGAAALFVMLGLFYRIAIVVLTAILGYFFLLDAAEYLNHFYMVLLYALILCVLPAARVWSLDACTAPRPDPLVPSGAVFLLRAQTEIVFVYAGLVKLTSDWLADRPLGIWLRARADGMWLEPILHLDWLIVFGNWGVIALHVLGAPLLLWRRSRLRVFLLYCVFHCANAWFFNIGIFPWLTIAASTIFFAPDWPARLVGCLRHQPVAPRLTTGRDRRIPVPRFALLAGAIWLAVQIVLPIRGVMFDTVAGWSGDGDRFSWRMRSYDRQAFGRFVVTDKQSGETWMVDPDWFLTPRQTDKMMVRSHLVNQFANHLAGLWRKEGRDVSVRAKICKSLNRRPYRAFIDPQADLTTVEWNFLGKDIWVLPMEAYNETRVKNTQFH